MQDVKERSNMANPNAEAQRRWREKQKLKRQESLTLPDALDDVNLFRQPFFEAVATNDNFQSVEIALDCAGIEPLQFEDDCGPRSFTGLIEQAASDGGSEAYPGAHNSLGRAEVIVGCLIDGAAELAGIINTYKRKEITARIAEIEESDLADPVKRKAALSQIMRLTKQMDRLDKEIRWTFKQWKIDEI